MLIVFAFALVPIFIAPVVPESRLSCPVVPDVTLKLLPEAEVRARVEPPAIVVAPLPVNVEAVHDTVNRVVLFVANSILLLPSVLRTIPLEVAFEITYERLL